MHSYTSWKKKLNFSSEHWLRQPQYPISPGSHTTAPSPPGGAPPPERPVQAEVRACSCQMMKQRGLDEWTLARTYCLEVVFEPILKSEIHRCFCMVIHKKTKLFSFTFVCVCRSSYMSSTKLTPLVPTATYFSMVPYWVCTLLNFGYHTPFWWFRYSFSRSTENKN